MADQGSDNVGTRLLRSVSFGDLLVIASGIFVLIGVLWAGSAKVQTMLDKNDSQDEKLASLKTSVGALTVSQNNVMLKLNRMDGRFDVLETKLLNINEAITHLNSIKKVDAR